MKKAPNDAARESQTFQAHLESDISEEAVKERRYLWMARTFALVCVVSFLANIILLGALFSLVPLVRVQPFYLSTQDKDEQIITVVRPSDADIDKDILAESFIRQYLLARFTVGTNIPALENTWGIDGIISWESAPSVFQEFAATSEALIAQAKREGFTRNVRILTVVKLTAPNAQEEIWQAELELSDMKQGSSAPTVSRWRATLQIEFRPNREGLRWSQRLKNPLGFTVVKFGMQAIK